MLILTQITDTIKVKLNSAATTQPQIMSSYRVIGDSTFAPARTVINTNGVNDVNAVPAPSASSQHVVDLLTIYNRDNIPHTVTVSFDANGTQYILFRCLLAANEQIIYQEGAGFRVLGVNGSLKTQQSYSSPPIQSGQSSVVLSSSVINNNAVANTLQDVTGLAFPVVTGNLYEFLFNISYSAASTATGSRWVLNGPSFETLIYKSEVALTVTAITTNNAVSYQQPVASNASSPFTTGNLATIRGFIKPTVDGVLQCQFASEVASSAITALPGSFVRYSIIA